MIGAGAGSGRGRGALALACPPPPLFPRRPQNCEKSPHISSLQAGYTGSCNFASKSAAVTLPAPVRPRGGAGLALPETSSLAPPAAQAILKHFLDQALDDIGCRDSQCHSFKTGYKDWKAAAAAAK